MATYDVVGIPNSLSLNYRTRKKEKEEKMRKRKEKGKREKKKKPWLNINDNENRILNVSPVLFVLRETIENFPKFLDFFFFIKRRKK